MPLRQWNIEGRCNVTDEAKAATIRELFRKTGAELAAALAIVCAEGNPKVVCYNTDFFEGVEELEPATVISENMKTILDRPEDEGISDELLQALKDSK